MDSERFDALASLFANKGSRRAAFTALASAALLGKSLQSLQAKGKGTRRGHARRGKGKGRKVRAQASKCYPGTTCILGTGRNNSGCDFENSTGFRNANLTGSQLSKANLRNIDARGANFTGCQLSGACLVDANLQGAIITGTTQTSGAIFCRTIRPDGTINNSGCNSATTCCQTCVAIDKTGCKVGGSCCGGATCQATTDGRGVCRCPAGTANCAGTCRNLKTDAGNCGGCGHACGQGQTCQGGICGVVCGAGFCAAGSTTPTCCAGTCTTVQSDAINCGTCGHACGDNAICVQSQCTCNETSKPCGATCIPQTDCCGGCAPGLTCCTGACSDTKTDKNNCDECGNICQGDYHCADGGCFPN